ncbi:two-partner secretion domain-containing protein [Anabaena subtropica]|nr:filamentous hemagglutinin N-terminal domain-containing protein [Anabaena subtropica]
MATTCAIGLFVNSAVAQITQDGTLPENSRITNQGNLTIIEGGTLSPDGRNLFHSFQEFSIPERHTAEFKTINSVHNIISRVTSNSISHIDGILKSDSIANLFLINPNGIIFGSNAALNIRGSFLASTASSLNFADGSKFSAVASQYKPLLTVAIPVGLQFGETANPIKNYSQARSITGASVGLQVPVGKTLALVGGNITLEGGNLTAQSGRIELGSVAPNSLVMLNPINQGWVMGYEGVQDFQDIELRIRRSVDGKNLPSQIDTSGNNGGNINLQGNSITLSGQNVRLRSLTRGNENGKDVTINARKLIVQDGAQIATSTINRGASGNLIVNASESVDIIGSDNLSNTSRTGLIGITASQGSAANIKITTGKLRILNGATITAESSALINNDLQVIAAEARGGTVTVNALESVEIAGNLEANIISALSARTTNARNTGTVKITTGELIVRDGGQINVSVGVFNPPVNLATSDQLNITARTILLDNQGKLLSNTNLGQGGDINLMVQDLLLMRRNSVISTSAGTSMAPGNGGNITINIPNGFVIGSTLGNSDITANAFSGSGGKITIFAKRIFGFVQRDRSDLVRLLNTEDPKILNPNNLSTNDITAFSQQSSSLNGVVNTAIPDADPSKSLVELPKNPVEASQQIVSSCSLASNNARSSFVSTGRGGIAPSPTDTLTSDAVLVGWTALPSQTENLADSIQEQQTQPVNWNDGLRPTVGDRSPEIVEAQGWIVDPNGKVVLVAQAQTVTPHNPMLNSSACAVLGSREKSIQN